METCGARLAVGSYACFLAPGLEDSPVYLCLTDGQSPAKALLDPALNPWDLLVCAAGVYTNVVRGIKRQTLSLYPPLPTRFQEMEGISQNVNCVCVGRECLLFLCSRSWRPCMVGSTKCPVYKEETQYREKLPSLLPSKAMVKRGP